MDDEIDAATAAVLEQARELGPAIDAASAEIDAIRDLPEPLFGALVERGLFRLLLPRAYGGTQLAPPAMVRFLEEIGKHDASTAWCLGQNNVCSTVAAYLAPDVAREIFATPRDILAWGPGPGTARPVPDGFVVDGNFNFASGSRHATWLGAHVPVVDADGKRRTAPDGSPSTHTMLFRREQAQVIDTWHVLGLKGTGSDGYKLTDLFVPGRFAMARNRTVKPRIDDALYVFTPSTLYSSSFAGIALGIARATFDAFVGSMRDTVPRGAAKPRGANNVMQSQVGQSEARIRAARAFLYGSLDRIWRDVQTSGALTEEQQLTIRLATTWAIQQSREVVTTLYMAAGAAAIFTSGPFEKRFRDIHTLTQQIQGHAAHFETVGQILLGLEPDRPMFTF